MNHQSVHVRTVGLINQFQGNVPIMYERPSVIDQFLFDGSISTI